MSTNLYLLHNPGCCRCWLKCNNPQDCAWDQQGHPTSNVCSCPNTKQDDLVKLELCQNLDQIFTQLLWGISGIKKSTQSPDIPSSQETPCPDQEPPCPDQVNRREH